MGCDSLSALFQGCSRIYFNPRTHVGCDTHGTSYATTSLEFQSTHPRGVRLLSNVTNLNIKHFNPRTHVGCDRPNLMAERLRRISIHAPTWGATEKTVTLSNPKRFQSTHPRGVRLSGNIEKQLRPNFNPRTHVGCDSSKQTQVSTQRAFQSTHPRGVRLCPYSYCFHTPYFNPRTHVGCDLFRIVF